MDRVLGRTAYMAVPAVLPNHLVSWADGHGFPMIAMGGGDAAGLLLQGLDDTDVARLTHYEAGFGYQLTPIDVFVDGASVPAQVFMPPPSITPGQAWDLQTWIKSHGATAFEAALEVMHRFGIDAPEAVARTYPMMQVRASARLAAQADPSPGSTSGLTAADVTCVQYRLPYLNYFSLAEVDIQVSNFAGGYSETVTRAGFMATDAAIVLPYDPKLDRVLMVEQFRMGPYLRSDPNPWMMEPVAGRVDAGEHPDVTAKREAVEEAGLTLHDLHHVHSGYASPGCSTEYFHVYVGLADLPDGCAGLGGLDIEAEDIKGHLVSWDDFYNRLTSGQLPVTPLALAGYWLAHNRDRLRNSG